MFKTKLLIPVIVSMATLSICSQADAQEKTTKVKYSVRVRMAELTYTFSYNPIKGWFPEKVGPWETVYETRFLEDAEWIHLCFEAAIYYGPQLDFGLNNYWFQYVVFVLGDNPYWYGLWPFDVELTVQNGDARPIILQQN